MGKPQVYCIWYVINEEEEGSIRRLTLNQLPREAQPYLLCSQQEWAFIRIQAYRFAVVVRSPQYYDSSAWCKVTECTGFVPALVHQDYQGQWSHSDSIRYDNSYRW